MKHDFVLIEDSYVNVNHIHRVDLLINDNGELERFIVVFANAKRFVTVGDAEELVDFLGLRGQIDLASS